MTRRILAVAAVLGLLAGCAGSPDDPGTTLALAEPVELTGAGSYTDPAWSPDGATISFSGPGYRGLYAVPASGGDVDPIAPQSVVTGFRHRWLDEPARILCPARASRPRVWSPGST